MNIMDTMAQIQKATLAARQRTGNTALSSNVRAGRFNLVEVTYPKGGKTGVVKTLVPDLSNDELIAALDALGAN